MHDLNFKLWFFVETDLGDELHRAKGVWQIPFKDISHDATEGYYFDHGKHHSGGSISDLSKVSVGDKVADYSLNMTPYWTVSGIDEQKQIIYLNPVEPNPLVTGVGAGGKNITDFDRSVLSGAYEDERVDQIIKQWQAGEIDDISDIAYLLLGTVPLNFGPNGAQGGWYTPTDTMANRGGQKGMSAQQIMQRDAQTVKQQFGFSVPPKALSGELDPRAWGDFVNGQSDIDRHPDTKLEDEDFENPQAMVKMILDHPQPSVKLRNAERLIDMYKGYHRYRKDQQTAWKRDDFDWDNPDHKAEMDEMEKRWKSGGYGDDTMLQVLHEVALKLPKIISKSQNRRGTYHDPYWHTKEKFIYLATEQGWDDVLEAFELAPDRDNRLKVYHAYLKRKDNKKMEEMLDRETSAENIKSMLEDSLSKYMGGGRYDYEGEPPPDHIFFSGQGMKGKTKIKPGWAMRYIAKHYDELVRKVQNAPDKKWYEAELMTFLKEMKAHPEQMKKTLDPDVLGDF